MKPSSALPPLFLAFVLASCGSDEDSGGSGGGGVAGKGGSSSSGARAGDGGGSSDAGDGAGGGSDGPGGSSAGNGGDGAGGSSDGAGGSSAGNGGADAAGGSPSTDPCARPPAVCGCDRRESVENVCFEFHGPVFTEASCAPAICPDGDLLEAECPPPTSGYCVGAVQARSELYYEDAMVSVAEMDCIAGGGTWCTP